jgi:hypothetical protein
VAVFEAGSGADEGDEVGCVDRPPDRWTIPELAGHIRSTSYLPASGFDADLIAEFGRHTANGRLTEVVNFAYDLARRSAPA